MRRSRLSGSLPVTCSRQEAHENLLLQGDRDGVAHKHGAFVVIAIFVVAPGQQPLEVAQPILEFPGTPWVVYP